MRAAPPVRAALGNQGLERVLFTLLHVITGAALAVWCIAHWAAPHPAGAGLAAFVVLAGFVALGAWLARHALPADGEQLHWDGQRWWLGCRSGAPVELDSLVVALDLGGWQLLHLRAAGLPPRWQVLRASVVGPAWHGLRLALAFHAGSALQPAGRRRLAPRHDD